MLALELDLQPADLELSDEQFYHLCQGNRDLRLERTASGKLVIMPPTGWGTGSRNLRLGQRLGNWADTDGTGIVFDSSTGFLLPNGAIRSPDVAWVRQDRLTALNPNPNQFLPLCPDFVIELPSAHDSLSSLQIKMQEYLAHGLQLGWLVNPQDQQVEIYRPEQEVEVLQAPDFLRGESVLPNLQLSLAGIL